MQDMTTRKRIQFSIDKGTAESAEYIMKKAGLSPASVISLVYSEIANTGKIPVSLKVSDEELAKAKLIRASYELPAEDVDTPEKAEAFLNDDGGY